MGIECSEKYNYSATVCKTVCFYIFEQYLLDNNKEYLKRDHEGELTYVKLIIITKDVRVRVLGEIFGNDIFFLPTIINS